ncbi:uncharacterized protein LOC129456201 isoform X1 [Periophthalmus magnuspinnatus]|uniref:uncharacterized protein LOC129456201 isoform X1 n=2 Tax=Periophthalmus magnuspinnatus TaxID=409849 RepID=UPI0024370CC0|nr:uncharacterized protein LOC129456201 isoform X1 [Periophthalmus magnuspinnatus]
MFSVSQDYIGTVMAMSPGLKLVLFFLLSCGLLNSYPFDSCPDFCTCQSFLVLNCSSAGLFLAPPNIDTSISELDLSNNQLGTLTFQTKYYNLQKVWLGNNSMTHLSLCVDTVLKGQSKSKLRRRWGCMLWAPTLQLLSVKMNQLEKLPEGLGQQTSLWILDLSFNKISTLEQKDFSHLKLLQELHLQHNLISSLHPQIFEHLDRLKVLDLSFNLLTTLHPITYISLHHIGADVGLRGNSWICDCGMCFLQRQMVHDSSKGLKTWSIECASPVALSGINLKGLDKDDLECDDSDIYQDVTVHKGSELLLGCSEPDAAWWTPRGQIMRSQELDSLLLTDITEEDEGLYVCLSKSHQIVSIYNVQIHEQNRSIRSVSDDKKPPTLNKMGETRNTVDRFALAVSLSVIITFIIAFILGVLLQPYICACWQKTKTRKQKPQTNSVSKVQQEQYVNEAYLHCEDVDDFETHRERRVTFTQYTEDENMQYYDTVAGDAQEGNREVMRPGKANSDSSDDSGSEDIKYDHKNGNRSGKKIRFEVIPHSTERNSLSSQSSKSSVGDKILKENNSTPNTTSAIEEQIQKTATDIPQISNEKSGEIPGFSSEPFADWSPHGNNLNTLDPDLDSGELFEYSDSVRSGSPISPNNSLKQPILNVALVNKDISLKSSSSSSDISDSEPTHYTVNPDSEEETGVFEKRASTKSSSSSIESDIDKHDVVENWPVVDLEHIPSIKRRLIFKNVFVESYIMDIAMKNKLQQEQTLPVKQEPPTIKKRRAPLPPPRKLSSSSSDSDEIGKFKPEKVQLETNNLKEVHLEQELLWPAINLLHVGKVKRRLNFKAFSSSDSEDKRIYEEIKEQTPIYSKQEFTKTTTSEFKHASCTSSSSESEDERENKEIKHNQDNIHLVISHNKQPTVKLEQESQWPAVNLAKIPEVKQRLDFKEKVNEKVMHMHENVPKVITKAPKLESGTSSSSESDDEHETKAVQENYYENIQQVISQKKPLIVVQKPQWQMIDLSKISKVKRRLDVRHVMPTLDTVSSSDSEEEHVYENVQGKVPTGVVLRPETQTSSSSESEDEREIKVHQENLQQATTPIKPPTVGKPDLNSKWPVIDLARLPKVKRRLDITERINAVPKRMPSERAGAKPDSETSSSSESEDEREIKIKQHQEKIQMVTSPNTQWPLIDLVKIPKVKQRLDIKEREQLKRIQVTERVPSAVVNVPKSKSETSSSSESEEEQDIKVNHYKNIQQVTSQTKQPTTTLEPESQWPVINLLKVPKLKRCLDIKERVKVTKGPERLPSITVKVPKEDSGTSSSNESEEEQEIKVDHYEIIQQVTSQTKQPTLQPESQWPVINLVKVPKLKHRLDIKESVKVTKGPERVPSTSLKVPKQDCGTSSSSESEEEQEIKVNYHENIQQVTLPAKQPTTTLEPESQWPVINLVKVPKLKRRLDIKERVKVTKGPERVPSTSLKVPKQDSWTSSSSESEEEQEIKVNYHENIQQVTSPAKQPTTTLEPESQWPVINLVKVPKLKRRLDIKERVKVTKGPERVPSTSLKVPKQDCGTSSSSESEEEQEIKVNYHENIQQVTSPTKQPTTTLEPESQWPVINLVKVPKLKRRLDIKERVKVTKVPERVPSTTVKVTKEDSGTSSSSESEEEQEIKVNHYGNIQQVTSPTKQPTLQPESQWPVINLVKLPKLKRRLDIKTATVAAYLSSSSSNSEDEQVHVTQGKLASSSINVKFESGTSSSSESDDEYKIREIKQDNLLVTSQSKQPIESEWPVIDLVKLPKANRRLDIKERVTVKATQMPSTSIKILKQDSGSSSSSESDHEQEIRINHQEIVPPTKPPTVDSQWPVTDLVRLPKVKRHIDIKKRENVNVSQVPSAIVQQLERYPSTNTISKPVLDTLSSSESEDENIQKVGVNILGSKVEFQKPWPIVDFGGITQIKRHLDFKIPTQSLPLPVPSSGGSIQTLVRSSSSSSDEERKSTQISAEQTTKLPSQTNIGIPYISRRLDIKGPSMKPGQDSESSSSSDNEKDKPKLSSGSLKYQENKDFIKASPILTVLHNPSKTTKSIELEKYTVVTDDKATSDSTSPVVAPELQSKWATMNLGVSRFRKRLDITKTTDPPSLPSSPPPTSPSQGNLITGTGMLKVTEQVYVAPTREQNVDNSSSSESDDDSKLQGKSAMAVLDSVSQVGLSSLSQDIRSLNIKTVQYKHSSSSSDEGTVDMRVPDLRLGIPQIKRRLNIKAPTPPPSSSSSDDEKLYAHTFPDVTDQRSIEYKRTIMKSSSYDSYTSKREMYREALHVQSNPQTPKKLSLDNIKRKLLPSKQQELPPNLRWTSVGSHLSEHPLPIPKRQQDGYTSPPPMSSLPPISKDNSSDSSSSEDEQKEVKAAVIVTQKTYNPRSVTFNTSPTILNSATFESKSERRGLSALKAMSSDRKNWDSEYETFTESAPVSVDYTPEVNTVYRRTVEVKTKISQAQTYSTVSPKSDERRLADMLYGIPSYKRHTIKSTELPQGPPPPVPSSPLPDEGNIDFTWRSPQASLSRGTLSYRQQKTTEEESVDDPFYDNPNISAV